LSAAASGKDESIRAVLNADAEAFPKLAASLDPDTKRAVALELRYHGDVAGRQTVDDLISLKESLTAVADDFARASDLAGDPIARMAAGG
jgi:Mg/Co/Ni transporter MgtE